MHPKALEIIAEARTWLGTPFVPQGRIKGVAADCPFLVAVANACGIHVDDHEGYIQQPTMCSLRRIIESRVKRVAIAEPGDVLMLKIDQYPQHLALLTEKQTIIHASRSNHKRINCVIEHAYQGKWVRNTVACYRFPE